MRGWRECFEFLFEKQPKHLKLDLIITLVSGPSGRRLTDMALSSTHSSMSLATQTAAFVPLPLTNVMQMTAPVSCFEYKRASLLCYFSSAIYIKNKST